MVSNTPPCTAPSQSVVFNTFVVDVLLSTPAQPQAYVEQNDNFYSMLTVAETLTMSSQLQLSPGMCADDKAKYVDNLISVLGLAKVCCDVADLISCWAVRARQGRWPGRPGFSQMISVTLCSAVLAARPVC